MKTAIPVLIIIPHGGVNIPDEFTGYEQIDRFGIFIESDACANEIFNFHGKDVVNLRTDISRIFVDLDRSTKMIPQKTDDGIIKKETPSGRKIFKDNIFPDAIAISNIIKRYYTPFHGAIEKIIKSGGIKLIIECHTMMPVGPRNSPDAGKPRPIIQIDNTARTAAGSTGTCPFDLVEELALVFNKIFNNRESSVAGKIALNGHGYNGYILNTYGQQGIPMFRFSLSRSLFLNDRYFNYDYMKVDELRLKELRAKIESGFERVIARFF